MSPRNSYLAGGYAVRIRAHLVTVLTTIGLAALSSAALAQGGPAGVLTALVTRSAVSETVPVFAQVVARRESAVAVRVSGAVTEVPIQTGDRVEAGAVLAVLDREILEIELRRAEAAKAESDAGLEVARAGLTLAEQSFARVEGLRGTTAFSQGTFEDRQGAVARARGEQAQAQARMLNAEANQARAAYDLERSVVRAPFAGVVLEVQIDPGEYVQTGAAVARIVDTYAVEVEANVPSQYVVNLQAGDRVRGRTDLGGEMDMTVRALLPTEFGSTRTRPVRFTADFAGADVLVAVGQSVTVDVPVSDPRPVLLVPKDAVVQARGAWQVFVHADGKAEPRTVDIGASYGGSFEVLSGLDEGDEVVVRGNERLRPMQEIAPERIDAPTDPAAGQAERGGIAPTATETPRQQAAAVAN
jgi:RND family efflux transporter MFP subunit